MVSSPTIERQKLLTRARNILLTYGLFTPEHVNDYDGNRGLRRIPTVGPGMRELILQIADDRNHPDHAYLFPYPNGLDERPYEPAKVNISGSSDDLANFAQLREDIRAEDEDDGLVPVGLVPVGYLEVLYNHLQKSESETDLAWAGGYTAALIDVATDEPGHHRPAPSTPQVRLTLPELGNLLGVNLGKSFAEQTGGHPDDCPITTDDLPGEPFPTNGQYEHGGC